MINKNIINELYNSLNDQEELFKEQLILNPVENVPKKYILEPATSFLHGLYNTDNYKSMSEKKLSKIQFSGRDKIIDDISKIYKEWENLLGAEAISMRLLSGLHAHIILFMSITQIGDKVVYLSEKSGGHTSGKAILERLGLIIKELPIDYNRCRIDKDKSIELINNFKPKIIFIYRSEGLIYEDFSWLKDVSSEIIKIFDASQYLTNILAKDYINPFDMGFDMILSTLHKNIPGPQRALICAKYNNQNWKKLKTGISTFVSNMHVFSIYSAGLLLNEINNLNYLSISMLKNAIKLDNELAKNNVPIVTRDYSSKEKPTHHCWIVCNSREEAFELYLNLENVGILTNYRLLPYNIGYGLRLGLSGATQQGLTEELIPELAKIISHIYHGKNVKETKLLFKQFIKKVKNDE